MKPAQTALLALVVALSGCQGVTFKPLAPLDVNAAAHYAVKGTASVSGQAYANSDGDKSHAAGRKVYLVPDLEHFQDWLHRTIGQGSGPDLDPRDSAYVRIVEADDSGNFNFRDVPEGKYLVLTVAFWEEPDPTGYMLTRGGPASAQIEVAKDAQVQVDLP